MESEQDAVFYIGNILWGYPDLTKKFNEVVRPAWIDARETRRRKIMKGKQRAVTMVSNSQDLLPEVTGQDEGDTTVLPQSNEDTPHGDGSGSSAVTKADVHSGSPGQLEEHLPPVDEHHPATASRITVAPRPTHTAPSPYTNDMKESHCAQ